MAELISIEGTRLSQIGEPFRLLKPGTSRIRTYAFYACICGEVKMLQVVCVCRE